MTKKELEVRVAQLERELRLVTQQLNNHICDHSVVYLTTRPSQPYPLSPFITYWTGEAVTS